MCRRLASTLALALLGPLAGCDDTFISRLHRRPDPGRQSAPAGIDPDTDGFSVSVDGGAEQFVAPAAASR